MSDRPPESDARIEDGTGLSVLIVSWNTRELLLESLRSFLPLETSFESEVIVVDNASSDGSADAVAESFPSVRVIRNSKNLGFAGGVNVGLRAASRPYVLLLNPDTRVVGGALQRLVAFAEANPKAGIIGPRVLNEDGSLQDSRFRFPTLLGHALSASYLYQLFPGSAFFNRERFGGSDASTPQAVDAVSGCGFLIRREVLDAVGLLDEGYFMYAEELDLCFRARRAGFEVVYAPVGEIVHLGGRSSRLEPRRNFLELRRSMLRFHWKHRGRAYTEGVRLLLMLYLALRVPYWALRSLLPSSERRDSAAKLGNYAAGLRFLSKPLPSILRQSEG